MELSDDSEMVERPETDQKGTMDVDIWTDPLRRELIKHYSSQLLHYDVEEATTVAYDILSKKGKIQLTRQMVAIEVHRLRCYGHEMLNLEGDEIEWPMMDEIKQMICLEGTAPVLLMQDFFCDCNGVYWNDDATKHLLITYTQILRTHDVNNSDYEMWKSVFQEIDPSIMRTFSKVQIKLRLNNLRNTYTKLRGRLSQNFLSQWSLYESLEALLQTQREVSGHYEETDSAEEAVDNCDQIRWTWHETKSLLEAYKRHVGKLILALSFKDKRRIWCRISSEIEMAKGRKCNPYIARIKIENMKKTWRKQVAGKGRLVWPYFSMMAKAMKEEERKKAEAQGLEYFDESDQEKLLKTKKSQFIPLWLLSYAHERNERHKKQMKLKMRFLNILEKIAKI